MRPPLIVDDASVGWLTLNEHAWTDEAVELVSALGAMDVSPSDRRRLYQVLGEAREAIAGRHPTMARCGRLLDASLALSSWVDRWGEPAWSLQDRLGAVLCAWSLAAARAGRREGGPAD